ncbi:hypothetical protein JCM8097_004183 [Rhodosporidiobolus ruineniae]
MLQVELHLKRGALDASGACLFPFEGVLPGAFGGTFEAGWTNVAGTTNELGVRWTRTIATTPIRGGSVEVYGRPPWSSGLLWKMELLQGQFPPTADGVFSSFPLDELWDCGIVLTLDVPGPLQTAAEQKKERVLVPAPIPAAASLRALTSSASPHDVVLVFPRCGQKIWTSQAVLSTTPYFAKLFSSGFAEAGGDEAPVLEAGAEDAFALDENEEPSVGETSLKRRRSSTPTLEASPRDLRQKRTRSKESPPPPADDSDDEVDLTLDKPVEQAPPSRRKTITITEASYSTYLAVLGYLHTNEIQFARLRALEEQNPPRSGSFLTPASPKSVYRLAHLLELPGLASCALFNLSEQLTPSIAAEELFSPLCRLYPEACQVVLRYIVDEGNGAAVMDTKEMKERLRRVEEEEAEPGEAAMVAKLMRKLVAT